MSPSLLWLLKPLLNVLISIQIALTDSKFVYRLRLKPSIANWILKYPAIAFERISRTLSGQRQDLLFKRFVRLHGLHYGPTGRGYQAIAGGTAEARLDRYRNQVSRLEAFVDQFPEILRYTDGDSFADLGCGSGQNIRFLAAQYPMSAIIGADMSDDAVEFVRECERHPDLQLYAGDMRNDAFLDSVLASQVDHIVLSHVFSLIFGDSAADTRAMRQQFVDRMVSSSRKSVVVIDSFGARDNLSIRIEQKQRAIVTDDVMTFFSRHTSGRTFMAQSARTQAVVFCRAQ